MTSLYRKISERKMLGGKRMLKFIASDMDGTLLDSNGCMSEEIYEIIMQLKSLGIIFAAASGRQLESLKKRFMPVDDDIIYLAENGTYVLYKGEELYSNVLERETVDEIIESINGIEKSVAFLCGKKHAYAVDEDLVKFMRQPIFGYDIVKVNDFSEVKDDILKISLFDCVDPRERSLKILGPKYKDKLYMAVCGYNCLDIMNMGASKGTAIKEIFRKFGINKNESIAFGDNYNDIEMLQEVGKSYAMGNAEAYVKSRASHIIGSNNENAVIETLKRIVEEIHLDEKGCQPRIGL